MNISIFIDVKLNRNGVGSYFHDLSVFFKENNMNVKLYNPESINKICGSFAYPGDKTQRIVFPSYKEIEKDIKKNRPDVLLFTFFGPITLAGMRIAKKYKIPYIYVMNSSLKEFIDFYYRGVSHFALQKSSSYVEKKLIKNAHHVVTVNSKMHEIPKKYNTQSVITLGTLIDSTFLKNGPTHLVNQINSILFFGRLAIEKNVDSFIQAAKQLPQLNFNIAGDGPLREMVEKKSTQITNLNYLGWVDRKEIINVIDSNDMVIMPSAFEALVANEALARAGASKKQQIANIQADATRDLLRGNRGVHQAVADAVRDTTDPKFHAGILKDLVKNGLRGETAAQYAKAYAPTVKPPVNSWRTHYQNINQAIAANPGAAIPVGAGAASAGALALITASGQALNDLSNFLAGGQQNQETRDNVLRS